MGWVIVQLILTSPLNSRAGYFPDAWSWCRVVSLEVVWLAPLNSFVDREARMLPLLGAQRSEILHCELVSECNKSSKRGLIGMSAGWPTKGTWSICSLSAKHALRQKIGSVPCVLCTNVKLNCEQALWRYFCRHTTWYKFPIYREDRRGKPALHLSFPQN